MAEPKQRAIGNLVTVIGNKPLSRIARADALDFQRWWIDRVMVEGVEIESANNDIGHLNKMLTKVEHTHRLGLGPVFSHMRIEGGQAGQRVAFTPDFVQARLLADGVLDSLNDEARRVLYLVTETGLRLSEACDLIPETIHLGGPVPQVRMRAIGRRMKTDQSEQNVPLSTLFSDRILGSQLCTVLILCWPQSWRSTRHDPTLFGGSARAGAGPLRGGRDDPGDRRGSCDQPVLRFEVAQAQAGNGCPEARADRRPKEAGAVERSGHVAGQAGAPRTVHLAGLGGGTGRAG